jgi:exonuclease VII large subunit
VLCFGNRIEHLRAIKRASRRIRQRKSQQKQETHTDAGTNNYDAPENNLSSSVPEQYPSQETTASDQRHTSSDNQVLATIKRKLSLIEGKLHQNAADADEMSDVATPVDVRMEWRILALVLDRLFFVIFFVTNCISFGFFHPRYVE